MYILFVISAENYKPVDSLSSIKIYSTKEYGK